MNFRCVQGGYALLLMLLALLGLGGIFAANYTQTIREETEHQRFLHNARVLREAKQALLMYAYNYPNIALPEIRGPGRLPCPDMDNDGMPESPPPVNCVIGANPMVGRFPWRANGMDFYDIRDASGERLWYAVSSSFDFAAGTIVNTGTDGSITIHGQNNNLLYDGSVDIFPNRSDRIAAVIIAPGLPIDRAGVFQDRSFTGDDPEDTFPDTDPGIVNAANYLDLFAGRDNTDFVNNDNADGFILGPVYGPNGELAVNDQIILVTAEEVTQVAQRAVLEAYRNSITAWQAAVPWGASPAAYPWLNDYDDITDLDVYHVIPGATKDTAGRVPYMTYYADLDSHVLITDLVVDFHIEYNLFDTDPLEGGTYLDAFDDAFSNAQLRIQDANLSFLQENWNDTSTSTDGTAATMVVDEVATDATILGGTDTIERTLYFWDGCASCVDVQDGWEVCAPPATDETDCAMIDGTTTFTAWSGDWVNHSDIRIRVVRLRLTLDERFELGLDPSQALTLDAPNPPTGSPTWSSATRRIDIANLVTNLEIEVEGVNPGGYVNDVVFLDITAEICQQDNDVTNDFNSWLTSNENSGSYDCMGDLNIAEAMATTPTQFRVTADYYPELPVWVRANGWNDSILMAYSPDYAPDGIGNCIASANCLSVNNEYDGLTTQNIALLVGASELPTNAGDLINIFDLPNNVPQEETAAADPDADAAYDANPDNNGDDSLLILSEN